MTRHYNHSFRLSYSAGMVLVYVIALLTCVSLFAACTSKHVRIKFMFEIILAILSILLIKIVMMELRSWTDNGLDSEIPEDNIEISEGEL